MENNHKLIQRGKRLSFLLRHDREYAFDEHGWREVNDLTENHGYTMEELEEIVDFLTGLVAPDRQFLHVCIDGLAVGIEVNDFSVIEIYPAHLVLRQFAGKGEFAVGDRARA